MIAKNIPFGERAQSSDVPMKFSVVTVSFNQRQYLEEALASVLGQDYPAIEYIVVDPGSTDGSRELILGFRDRLASIVFEPDQGAADGLNKGFQRASGDIFGFLNSDDVLLPGAMKAVSRAFEQNPDCDIVMGNGFIVDAGGKRIRRIRAAGFTLDRYFYGGATWLQQATFFRRTAFEQVGGFNVDNRSCWDGELIVDMVRLGSKVKYVNQDLALFRIHAQSITGSRRHSEMMKADADRMFSLSRGRQWTALDTLRAYLVRVERILTHPGAVESAIRARVRRS
jgi:glycosyltransferase involved in cell wall biosynthesis